MPARRKTPQQLALSGAMKKNPARHAIATSTSDLSPLGQVPRHLTEPQRELWREVVDLMPEGALAASDRLTIEAVVRMLERVREGHWTRASEFSVLVAALGRLGMSPSDRQKLSFVAPTKAAGDDPWDDLAAPARAK